MSKIALVAQREFMENLKTKAFWIGLLVFPVIIIASVIVPVMVQRTKEARRYAVIDQSGWLLQAVEDRAKTDDVRRLLNFVKEKAREGGRDLAALPESLASLAKNVKDASATQIDAMARAMTGAAQAAGSPAEAVALDEDTQAAIDRNRTEVMLWMASLKPEDARKIGAGLGRGRYVRIDVPAGEADPEASLRKKLDEGNKSLFAFFVIAPDPLAGSSGCKYVSSNQTDEELKDWFSRLSTEVVTARRFAKEGIDRDVAKRIEEPLVFEAKQLSAGKEKTVGAEEKIRQWAPVVFVYLLWISVLMSSSMLLTNTVEEKSNRIIEVLLSSVSPLELMSGKILGIALTGLTIICSWVASFVLVLKLLPRIIGPMGGIDLSVLISNPTYLLSFVAYFLLGYLLYAAILVALGSVCNSMKEAQNLMQPVTLMLVVPLLTMIPVVRDPNGTLAKVLSFIPPFTPFVMMNRAAGPPATWEYVATTLLLMAAIVATFWMAAKVFRIGVLMTGKPPKLSEILHWIRTPVGQHPARH